LSGAESLLHPEFVGGGGRLFVVGHRQAIVSGEPHGRGCSLLHS
jgi:hypothetical protein